MYSTNVTCLVSPNDVEWSHGKEPISVKGVNVFAVYMYQADQLKLLKLTDSLEVTLEPFNYELLTVSPVLVLPKKWIQFAPIGLVNMLNTGAAVQSLEMDDDDTLVRIGVRGCGEMRVFASEKPLACKIDGTEVKFSYKNQMVMVQVHWPGSSTLSMIELLF